MLLETKTYIPRKMIIIAQEILIIEQKMLINKMKCLLLPGRTLHVIAILTVNAYGNGHKFNPWDARDSIRNEKQVLE